MLLYDASSKGSLSFVSRMLTCPRSSLSFSSNAHHHGSLPQQLGCSVSFVQTPAGVLLRLSLIDVPTGEHAFHIHAVGKCEPPGFDSAGGHFNPANARHGMMSGPGHAGDMPNLHVPASGALDLEVLNASITLDKDKPNSVFHAGGTAIVIHAGKDDYTSDPAGNAGGRIICGVISE